MDVYLDFVTSSTFSGNSKSDLCNTTSRKKMAIAVARILFWMGFTFYGSRDLVIFHVDSIRRGVI